MPRLLALTVALSGAVDGTVTVNFEDQTWGLGDTSGDVISDTTFVLDGVRWAAVVT